MGSRRIISTIERYSAQNYDRYPFVVARAEGAGLWDPEGNLYVDFLGGYGGNPEHMWDVATEALQRYLSDPARHAGLISNVMYSVAYAEFCETICRFTEYDRVLAKCGGGEVCNSVLEAFNLHAEIDGIKTPEVIVIEHCFHGRGNHFQNLYKGRETVWPKLVQVAHSAKAVEEAINGNTVGILMEVQGGEGCRLDKTGVYPAIHQVARKYGKRIVVDEIQAGFGRCGPQFSFQKWGEKAYRPDGMVLAKILGGGMEAVSAFVGTNDLMRVFKPDSDGSTFSGNPKGCIVATAVLRYLEQHPLGGRACEIGKRFADHLAGIPHITVEYEGAMICIKIEGGPSPKSLCHDLVSNRHDPRVFMKYGHTYGNTHYVRATPPILAMTNDILDKSCVKTIRPAFMRWSEEIEKSLTHRVV